MSQALLSLLLTVLLVRSHELYRDDIISTLFYILTNDNNNNFAYFIHNYLEQSNIQTVLKKNSIASTFTHHCKTFSFI